MEKFMQEVQSRGSIGQENPTSRLALMGIRSKA
jgi:hypothetical protein